ncbi:MAG: bifunctional NADH-specific enoyl-ACP reductase/trans-2-enoyl-CoA reductase, partial [Polyangia bacterium]
MATPQVITARIRGFLCLNAHPTGCAANVDRQIQVARTARTDKGPRDALIIGGSTGYGLSSLVTTVFGYGARALNVCLERPPHGEKSASAGWYNVAALQRRAKEDGRTVATINGDAYSTEIKNETVARLKSWGAKL